VIGIFGYAVGWLFFAMVHSLLARLSVQKKIEPRLHGGYRLLYNLISTVQLIGLVVFGKLYIESNTYEIFATSLAAFGMASLQISGVVIIVLMSG